MSGRIELAVRFLASCGAEASNPIAVADALELVLDRCRSAWTAVRVADDTFVDWLGARVRAGEAPLHALSALRSPELYLACAGHAGDPAAVGIFEKTHLCRIGQFIGRLQPSPTLIDDTTQALRIKLFVGRDGAGKLAQYSGRGALDSWICAAALRTAQDLLREQGDPCPGDGELDLIVASDDAEIELLRVRHREQFRVALEEAMLSLPARDRALLRLYFLESLTAAQLGKLYRVHETTALRWIAAARATVLASVRERLQQRLQLRSTDLDQLIWLLQSRFELTFRRILAAERAR